MNKPRDQTELWQSTVKLRRSSSDELERKQADVARLMNEISIVAKRMGDNIKKMEERQKLWRKIKQKHQRSRSKQHHTSTKETHSNE